MHVFMGGHMELIVLVAWIIMRGRKAVALIVSLGRYLYGLELAGA